MRAFYGILSALTAFLCTASAKWLPGKRLSSRESAQSVQAWVSSLVL